MPNERRGTSSLGSGTSVTCCATSTCASSSSATSRGRATSARPPGARTTCPSRTDDIAEEIIENLEAGLESFRGVLSELQSER
ncbi:hypothetical protein Mlg_1122 [Alkalilimnicola ehrlichii MLHE-1]|uniref:Uncharacterized protein n=1 Tax=Alkalilimnicola ehrlichii (strain ATCC BAA-1101 / DSM 17681 / MLHE-1) TaxID=187272 RepID=Q0A9L4_ALKEH|nr:hypothetical protein Mlg_1122 [Alkalilimnicola ehrlichii MLHE-1]